MKPVKTIYNIAAVKPNIVFVLMPAWGGIISYV